MGDPNDEREATYEILAEHFVITENLHPDAKAPLANFIRDAVEAWLADEADEFRNKGGA
jgi:hypothetical protein